MALIVGVVAILAASSATPLSENDPFKPDYSTDILSRNLTDPGAVEYETTLSPEDSSLLPATEASTDIAVETTTSSIPATTDSATSTPVPVPSTPNTTNTSTTITTTTTTTTTTAAITTTSTTAADTTITEPNTESTEKTSKSTLPIISTTVITYAPSNSSSSGSTTAVTVSPPDLNVTTATIPINTTIVPTAEPSTTPVPQPPRHNGASVALTLFILLAVILIIGAVVWWIRRRRQLERLRHQLMPMYNFDPTDDVDDWESQLLEEERSLRPEAEKVQMYSGNSTFDSSQKPNNNTIQKE